MRLITYMLLFLFFVSTCYAKNNEDKKLVKRGNKSFSSKQYMTAEVQYRKALEKNNKNKEAAFNLGDAIYKQKKYKESGDKFLEMTTKNVDDKTKSKSYYNYGNSLLQENKFAESIDAYKKALRLDPADLDAKYNLEFARKMLAQQQNQQKQNKNGDKNNQSNQSNQNQNQEKNQNNTENKDQQSKNEQNKDQQNKNEQKKGEGNNKQDQNNPQNSGNDQDSGQRNSDQKNPGQKDPGDMPKIKKDEMDRILKALNNNERNIQKRQIEKDREIRQKGKKKKIGKNW